MRHNAHELDGLSLILVKYRRSAFEVHLRFRVPWPPIIPPRMRNALAPFTAYAGGWCRWHAGKMVHVCGKKTPLDQVEAAWHAKLVELNSDSSDRLRIASKGITIREAATRFYEWLDVRVSTGKPNPLAQATREDYVRIVNDFGRIVGPDRAIAGLDSPDFTAYAERFHANSPYTLTRVVANVTQWLQWCFDERLIDRMPAFGRSFVKPRQQARRDKRMSETKSYTTEQLISLRAACDVEAWAWMALALTGAIDNSDIGHLTFDLIDRTRGCMDYRRRKTGLKPRVIPLHRSALLALDAYLAIRPEPSDEVHKELVFLTPTGLPLQRFIPSKKTPGRNNPIDYVAMRWTRIMIAAGLRDPFPERSADDPRRVKAKGSAAGQGFRALRTTWANLVPPGFGDERAIIMGHQSGTFVESYLERYGLARLSELVTHVWGSIFTVA